MIITLSVISCKKLMSIKWVVSFDSISINFTSLKEFDSFTLSVLSLFWSKWGFQIYKGWSNKLWRICKHDASWHRLEKVLSPLFKREVQQPEHQTNERWLSSDAWEWTNEVKGHHNAINFFHFLLKWFKDISFLITPLHNLIWGHHLLVIPRHQKAYTKFNHKHKKYWRSSFRGLSLGMLLFVAWGSDVPKDTHKCVVVYIVV